MALSSVRPGKYLNQTANIFPFIVSMVYCIADNVKGLVQTRSTLHKDKEDLKVFALHYFVDSLRWPRCRVSH